MIFAFYTWLTFARTVQKHGGKNCWCLSINPVSNTKLYSNPGILHHHTLTVNIFKMLDLPTDILDEAVKKML